MQEEAVDAIDRQFEDEEEHAELPQSRKNILRDWVGPLDVIADNVRVHRKDGEVQRHDGHVFKWPGVLGHAGAQLKEVRPERDEYIHPCMDNAKGMCRDPELPETAVQTKPVEAAI